VPVVDLVAVVLAVVLVVVLVADLRAADLRAVDLAAALRVADRAADLAPLRLPVPAGHSQRRQTATMLP